MPLHSRRIISTFESQFPAVLSINAGVHSKENLDVWLKPAKQPGESPYGPRPQHFLPLRFGIRRYGDQLHVVTNEKDFTSDLGIYSLKVSQF